MLVKLSQGVTTYNQLHYLHFHTKTNDPMYYIQYIGLFAAVSFF